ncbi:Eukaryotic translation initiation factor 3 subunit E-like [Oopsacas minuta]|uniref:Eukaryotic translation initiation factor 3 subunit E n=1 Tax=Oopsacas minuta TaxID=111878 RepID=A0AAV7JFJ4_9METZ|nr:Eukaryotic translation initiation factor 3 subunit E-like [Oopsacas minuta]
MIYSRTEAKKTETGQDSDELFHQLCEREGMTASSMVADLYQFAKLNYECGDYESALDTLTWFFTLANSQYNQEEVNSANWGRLACEILLQKFDDALNNLDQLRESIDRGSETQADKQIKRCWWVHWSLFVFFHHEDGLDRLAQIIAGSEQELREDRVLLSTIQNHCPYLFRYFAVAALLSTRGDMVKRLLQFITDNRVVTEDPIVEFLLALYKDFDFPRASKKLGICFDVVQNDFFLTGCYQMFIEAAKRAVLQNFITIYQCISLKMLAECMHVSEAQAEQWIVKYIQEKNLIAKINAKEAHVIIKKDPPPIHQQMLDKTQDLKLRSSVLHQKVRQKYEENQKKGRGGSKHISTY